MIYNLIITNVPNEESPEVFVSSFSTLDKALAAQTQAVEKEVNERSEEKLTVDEYIELLEKVVTDENGGYVSFVVQSTELE